MTTISSLRRAAQAARMAAVALALGVGCGESGNDTAADPDAGTRADAGDAGKPELVEGVCSVTDPASPPDSLSEVACKADFLALSSAPIDATLPGSRSTKVVLDQADSDTLYFQNSQKFQIHYEFVSTHLSGDGLPVVGALADFNTTEYYKPDRRFLLGAVTYYEAPDVWALEISPYDTMTAAQLQKLYEAVASHAYFRPALAVHPTSTAITKVATSLSSDIPIVTTGEIYAGTDYQPLTLGEGVGKLRFVKTEDLEDTYLGYHDIVVLDAVPNDISAVAGLITEEFQTPLSHVNVLSENRGTPNMGLRGAMENAELRALEGKWVRLVTRAADYSVSEVSEAEAEAYIASHRPAPVTLPALDLTKTGLFDIDDVVVENGSTSLRDLLKEAVRAFGGKAAHYSILHKTPDVPIRDAFAIPVFYYDQFMRQNGFYERVDALLADPSFLSDDGVRDAALAQLRADMELGEVDAGLQSLLQAKLAADYAGMKVRFRTSTNSEDLDGFPCAGCYDSHTGDPADFASVLDAIRATWATVWKFRTFEERSFYGIDHKSVGMALLAHQNFPDPTEKANGVAVTANPFDATGLEPGFYVNVQYGGDAEVVAPPPGITSDEFLYFYSSPNQPITFLSHSNLVREGETVLTSRQTYDLGKALDAIHTRFSSAYGPAAGNAGWYAMDVEFKFDSADGGDAKLYVKQARPYPGRGSSTSQ
jgi:pyruvate, water dikinase